MSSRNHFVSWSKQNEQASLDVSAVGDFSFQLRSGEWVDDGLSCSYNCAFGYSERRITTRIAEVLKDFPCASPKWNLPFREKQTERLLDFIALGEGRIFYTVSGAEAVENVLKIARLRRDAVKVLSRSASYHGASLGALSVGGDWRTEAVQTFEDWTVRIPEPSEDSQGVELRKIVERVGAKNIAAICMEAVTGSNGVFQAPDSWWQAVNQLCSETGIYLILDEVTSGFYRCGHNFAFSSLPVKPDMVCFSKAISGGYSPFGAVYVSEEIAKTFTEEVLPCGGTNYGSTIGIAAMAGVLDLFEDQSSLDLIAENTRIFEKLSKDLGNNSLVDQTRVVGMLAAFDLNQTAPSWQEFIKSGLHIGRSENRLILAPPLTIDPDILQRIFEKVNLVLEEIA